MAAEANVRVILDARGEPLKLALALHPFVVKPNRAELAETVGVSIDSDKALRDARRRLLD